MVPVHPSHSALGAFHPTPIASSRISTHPTARRRRRKRARMQCGTLRRGRRRGRNPPERSCATVGARVNPHPDGGHPRPGDIHDVALPVARPVRLPRRSTPHHRGCARRQDRDGESAPRAQPEGSPRRPLPRRRRTPARPAPRRRAAREARFPVGSARPLHRRAAAKMSPRIRTGPEAALTAHAPSPSAAADTARRKPDQVPITEQSFFQNPLASRPSLVFYKSTPTEHHPHLDKKFCSGMGT